MHLIEVMDPADLKKVRYSRFQKRLSEARNAFDVVQLFFSGDKLKDGALKVLSKISCLNSGQALSRIGEEVRSVDIG